MQVLSMSAKIYRSRVSFCCLLMALSFQAVLAEAKDPAKDESHLRQEASETLSADEILLRCDKVRNPADSYEMIVRVVNHDGSETSFQVYTKGLDSTLIKTIEPKRDVGRDLLMLGEHMWAYVPNLKRSVRVSLSQKLSGQAANGDIARMRWAADYDATIEEETDKFWVLNLKAKKKGLTYDGLKVWVEKQSFHPIKAEYLALSGKLLKRARFEDFKNLAGRVRPAKMIIEDAHASERHSVIHIESMKTAAFPDIWFKPSQLGR